MWKECERGAGAEDFFWSAVVQETNVHEALHGDLVRMAMNVSSCALAWFTALEMVLRVTGNLPRA